MSPDLPRNTAYRLSPGQPTPVITSYSIHYTKLYEVCGRLDNQFVCGGENIQPEQIEAALIEHPDVAQALVVPLADAQWGHRPVAFIQWHPGAAVDDLEGWLRQRLPGYLVPRSWLAWPPQQTGLKPARRDFAALASRQLARITSYNVCYTKLLRPPVAGMPGRRSRGGLV